MKIFHKHQWEIVSSEEQPSQIEIYSEAGYSLSTKGTNTASLLLMGQRPVIVTRHCRTCGVEEVKRV